MPTSMKRFSKKIVKPFVFNPFFSIIKKKMLIFFLSLFRSAVNHNHSIIFYISDWGKNSPIKWLDDLSEFMKVCDGISWIIDRTLIKYEVSWHFLQTVFFIMFERNIFYFFYNFFSFFNRFLRFRWSFAMNKLLDNICYPNFSLTDDKFAKMLTL